MLEGFHPLKHALRFGAAIEAAGAPDLDRLDELARALAPDVRAPLRRLVLPLPPATFAELAPVAPATGVVAIARRPEIDPAHLLGGPRAAPLVLLDGPSHFGNVGAAIRVAAAAGAGAVLTVGAQDPWHPAAVRGSAGLHFALPVARIEELPETERSLVAIDPDGEPLRPDAVPAGAILAFGSERRGLGEPLLARAERRVAIPMRAGVSSLNLASAVAVVLYAWRLAGSS